MSKENKQKPPFEGSSFELPKFEVPAAFRDFAEKNLAQGKDAYEKFRQAAEQTSGAFESVYATYNKGAQDIAYEVLNNVQANVNSAFDFARSFFCATTFAEAVEEQSRYASQQVENFTKQSAKVQKLITEVANTTSEKAASSFRKTA